jgi:hypothetical protein
MRASCARPAVNTSSHVYDNEAAALMALIQFRPQLVRFPVCPPLLCLYYVNMCSQICVRSKHDMDSLAKNNLLTANYERIVLHHIELTDAQKASAFSVLHQDDRKTVVIATSGVRIV